MSGQVVREVPWRVGPFGALHVDTWAKWRADVFRRASIAADVPDRSNSSEE